jgi:hypothetical protein
LREVWQERGRGHGRRRHQGCQLFATRFQIRQLLVNPGRLEAVGNRLDQVLDLAFDGLQFSPAHLGAGRGFGGQAVPFRDERLAERLGQIGPHETPGQSIEHPRLEC